MKISFINMVANLCEAVGADVTKVAQGMGLDPRIGSAFLNPGIGFGGFCFPKDVQAFVRIAEKSGCDFSLLKEVEKINRRRVEHFVEKIRERAMGDAWQEDRGLGSGLQAQHRRCAFCPSIALLRLLVDEGAMVSAYDPEANEKARAVLPDVRYCADPYEAAQGAEAVLLVTEWDEFRRIDWERLQSGGSPVDLGWEKHAGRNRSGAATDFTTSALVGPQCLPTTTFRRQARCTRLQVEVVGRATSICAGEAPKPVISLRQEIDSNAPQGQDDE